MIIYFHLAKNKDKKEEENPGLPWVSNWNREQLVARMIAEIDGHMKPSALSESDPSETEVDFFSESELKEDSKEPRRKYPKRTAKKVFFPNDYLLSKKRKQILEDSSSESKSESNDKMQSKKRKHIIEDSSSEEEIHSYDG
ncbi:hypothetical protein Ahy_B05g078765 [Arachis hypogaea]|uniref:Uncharacterized protein n=1 Tax=Arachis hypogaea TaxID=3818 RepID=A0A444Z7Z4_ARAHY|nr:hypothetical protein Ahy_B05g078765 [Arachis hypogaea]